jgi:hypothetical protein
MTALLAALLLTLPSSRAAAAEPEKAVAAAAAEANKTTIQLVEYFLKTPIPDANPKLIEPFLAVDTETLPKKLRLKARAKQVEISTILKLHDTKKAGSLIQPLEGCSEKDFVFPLAQADFYLGFGNEEVNEDELSYVKNKTKCTEIDLGCRFSLKIFFTKGKPRRLEFYGPDPIMALVAESHKGGSTNFFGSGLTCMH